MLRSSTDSIVVTNQATAYHQSKADSRAYGFVCGHQTLQELENSDWDDRQMDRPGLCLGMKKHCLWLESTIAFTSVFVGLRGDSPSTMLSYSSSHQQFVPMALIASRRRGEASIWPRGGILGKFLHVKDANGLGGANFRAYFGRYGRERIKHWLVGPSTLFT